MARGQHQNPPQEFRTGTKLLREAIFAPWASESLRTRSACLSGSRKSSRTYSWVPLLVSPAVQRRTSTTFENHHNSTTMAVTPRP